MLNWRFIMLSRAGSSWLVPLNVQTISWNVHLVHGDPFNAYLFLTPSMNGLSTLTLYPWCTNVPNTWRQFRQIVLVMPPLSITSWLQYYSGDRPFCIYVSCIYICTCMYFTCNICIYFVYIHHTWNVVKTQRRIDHPFGLFCVRLSPSLLTILRRHSR